MKNSKGFTLIEILIAITIFFSLSYLSYMSVDGAFVLSGDVKKEEDFNVKVVRVIDRIKRELSNAFLTKNGSLNQDVNVRTIFKAENSDIDKITFTSFSHLRMNFNSKESDQSEISYFGRSDKGSYKLMRRESYFINNKPEKGGRIREIADGVKSFHCKYYKEENEDWVTEWNTEGVETGEKLPKYIRCEITFMRPLLDGSNDPQEEKYYFAVKITLNEKIK